MSPKNALIFRMLFLVIFGCSSLAFAQENTKPKQAEKPEEVIRVKTRVVFVDVAVTDKKTNAPVRDLSLENFQVLDDGKPRTLSYFSREGDTRRPLSLVLFVDLWTMYGRKFIKEPAAMSRLAHALRKLAPEDEVAIMGTWIEASDELGVALPKVKTISNFTTDRQRTIEGLRSIPKLVSEQEKLLNDIAKGAGVGKWDIELAWSLTEIAETVMSQALARPTRQFIVAGLIDDLFVLNRGERNAVAETSARTGITFYGLVYKKSLGGKLLFGTINQIVMRPGGKSLHAADYLAERTGGQVLNVGRPEDLASGLEKIIDDLAARYSLGFELEDDERDDGQMHRLEVKVQDNAALVKKRKLNVRARQGYYISGVEK